MSTITYSTARDHLAEVWDKTVSTREPVVVSRRGTESIVMLPLEEGVWSRRITQEHRLVYKVAGNQVRFAQTRYH
jgi:hypothetical protein